MPRPYWTKDKRIAAYLMGQILPFEPEFTPKVRESKGVVELGFPYAEAQMHIQALEHPYEGGMLYVAQVLHEQWKMEQYLLDYYIKPVANNVWQPSSAVSSSDL